MIDKIKRQLIKICFLLYIAQVDYFQRLVFLVEAQTRKYLHQGDVP